MNCITVRLTHIGLLFKTHQICAPEHVLKIVFLRYFAILRNSIEITFLRYWYSYSLSFFSTSNSNFIIYLHKVSAYNICMSKIYSNYTICSVYGKIKLVQKSLEDFCFRMRWSIWDQIYHSPMNRYKNKHDRWHICAQIWDNRQRDCDPWDKGQMRQV